MTSWCLNGNRRYRQGVGTHHKFRRRRFSSPRFSPGFSVRAASSRACSEKTRCAGLDVLQRSCCLWLRTAVPSSRRERRHTSTEHHPVYREHRCSIRPVDTLFVTVGFAVGFAFGCWFWLIAASPVGWGFGAGRSAGEADCIGSIHAPEAGNPDMNVPYSVQLPHAGDRR